MAQFDPHGGQIFRGNDFVVPDGYETRDIVNPATLEIEGTISLTTPAIAEEVARIQVGQNDLVPVVVFDDDGYGAADEVVELVGVIASIDDR